MFLKSVKKLDVTNLVESFRKIKKNQISLFTGGKVIDKVILEFKELGFARAFLTKPVLKVIEDIMLRKV